GHAVPSAPLFFLKPPSALLPPGGAIQLPELSQQVEYEGELGLVMRRRCSRLAPDADLRPYVLGFTCVNDVTARDLQNSDPQWTRAKGFDTFCPVGPWVIEPDAGSLGAGWQVETRVNGEARQHGATVDFIFSLGQIFAAITAVMTLEPGDLIATGTPAGVGRLQAGDEVAVTIVGPGASPCTLRNSVVARGPRP
ncbi:MAG: fumarylacetoacetate hydrolase family protein, partial [Terriglobales bacterium]